MAAVYDEVEIEDMEFDETEQVYYYPCPCGDRFSIDLEELHGGEEIAMCPSCSLTIRVVFDKKNLPEVNEDKASIHYFFDDIRQYYNKQVLADFSLFAMEATSVVARYCSSSASLLVLSLDIIIRICIAPYLQIFFREREQPSHPV